MSWDVVSPWIQMLVATAIVAGLIAFLLKSKSVRPYLSRPIKRSPPASGLHDRLDIADEAFEGFEPGGFDGD